MPELPEVETVRRTLALTLIGRRIERARVTLPKMLAGPNSPKALGEGMRFTELRRHGKQLAMIVTPHADPSSRSPLSNASPSILLIQLGMTGSLRHVAPDWRPPTDMLARHHHVIWRLDDRSRLIFRDPRQFGLLTILDEPSLTERWQALGPDAIEVTTDHLRDRLGRTNRAIKAALLDQNLVAGLGNIYVDESLFRAGIHPLTMAPRLGRVRIERLTEAIHTVLARALEAGGSSLRDYVNGRGEPGMFQLDHAVYGRAGQPCLTCGRRLASRLVAQRMTVWCARCQRK